MYGCFMSGFCVCSRVCLFVAAFWWIEIISTKWSSSCFSLSSSMCASWGVNTMTFEQSIWYNLVTILVQTLTATLAGTVNTCCCNYIDEAARNEWGRQISGPPVKLNHFPVIKFGIVTKRAPRASSFRFRAPQNLKTTLEWTILSRF